jgi:hypothetical protein
MEFRLIETTTNYFVRRLNNKFSLPQLKSETLDALNAPAFETTR